jgi:hypothetical protein
MVAKLTRLTHKIAIQLHLVAESCTICSSRSRRPVRDFWIHPRKLQKKLLKLTKINLIIESIWIPEKFKKLTYFRLYVVTYTYRTVWFVIAALEFLFGIFLGFPQFL